MKKYKILGWSGTALALILLFLGNGLEARYEDDWRRWLFIGGALVVMLISLILLDVDKKKEKQELEKTAEEDAAESKRQVELHYRDCAVNEIVYEYENGGLDSLREAISRSSCNVEAGYDRETEQFYLMLAKFDVGFMKVKLPFLLQVIKKGEQSLLVVNEEETDVSDWTKEAILEKLIKALDAENSKDAEEPIDFEVGNPKPVFYFFLVLFALSFIASVVVLVLYAVRVVETEMLVWLILSGMFLALSLLGLWGYFREKFTLKNGVYTNRSMIKTQSCKARDVAKVEFQPTNGRISYVVFIGRNGEQLMKCADDGTMLRGGKFKRSLNYYDIKLEYK